MKQNNPNENTPDTSDTSDQDIMVTLDLDNGEQLDCEILTIFTVNEQDYIVLMPVDEHGEPLNEEQVYIYRYFEDEDQNPKLDNIATDEEYDAVAKAFDKLQEEAL